MEIFVQQLVNGLTVGTQYSLWAIGFGLVYQVLGVLNLAHGDSLVVGLFCFFGLSSAGVPLPVAAVLAMACAAAIFVGTERFIFQPLNRRGAALLAVVAALGAALIMRNLITLKWGTGSQPMPAVLPTRDISIGDVRVNSASLIGLLVAILIVLLVRLFLNRTAPGRSIRAVAQDQEVATLMGISPRVVTTGVYALAGVVGMVGALMFAQNFGVISPTMGFVITLKAWMAAIIGGMTRNINGAIVGGLILGVTQTFIEGFVSSTWTNAILAAILIGFLLMRPHGVLGKPDKAKL